MGQIKAYYTCTRVMWQEDEDGFPLEEPVTEHGWIDRRWSSREVYDNRNDVSPVIDLDESDPELAEEVRDAIGWLDGGGEDNGDGTFYSRDSYQPFDEAWHYSYAIHFSRKFLGPDGWTETKWHPKADGGIDL